jgi:hypothetical protein
MSNDENSNKTEAENSEEKVESTTQKVENVAEETPAVEEISEDKESAVSKAMAIKESNPKLFFGAIGAVVVVILGVMMMGGETKNYIPAAKQVNLSIGQSYSLNGVNSHDPSATVRLVDVPGSIAAYGAPEEGGKKPCQHLPEGTKVKLLQVQEAFGKATQFVQVEILNGECANKKGWAISNNLE